MSGRKYTNVTLPQRTYNDLRRRALQAANLETSNRYLRQLNDQMEAAVQAERRNVEQLNDRLTRLNRQLVQNHEANSRETNQLRMQLRSAVEQSNRSLMEAAHRHQQEMRRARTETVQMIEANNQRTQEILNRNNEQISTRMEHLRRQGQERMDELQRQMDAVEEQVRARGREEETLREMAGEYLRTAAILNQDTRENYRVELLCPGRLQEVQDQFASAQRETDDAQKMPANAATARHTARLAMEAALQLHEDVIRAEQEWNLRYEAARQVLDETQTHAQASRIFDLQEEQVSVTVDTDHWTDGDLTDLEARIHALRTRMEQREEVSVSELGDIREAGVQIGHEIDNTVAFAAEAVYSSQDRVDIAQELADSLQARMGLRIEAHSYQGNDQRAAHRLHLRNPLTKFEMILTQTPQTNADGRIANRLESDILNYGTLNETDGDSVARAALETLSEYGFEQSPVSTVPGYEGRCSDRTQNRDMERFRMEKVPVLKPHHREAQAAPRSGERTAVNT